MAFIDEPVRGSIPPPWWWSLSGIERMQALAREFLPRPPLSRFLGIRAGHIGPAFCTWTMPATGWLAGTVGELDITLYVEAALTSTAMTAVGPAQTVEPLSLDLHHFRPIRPASGNLVARCRVVNASRFFLYSEAEVEDPFGRQLLHASSHAAIRQVEPEPPPAPAELRRVDEPIYSLPDPCLRPLSVDIPTPEETEAGRALDQLRSYVDGGGESVPVAKLLGYRLLRIETGSMSASVPASEWLCLFSRNISHGALAMSGNSAGSASGQVSTRAGDSFVGLSQTTRFLGSIPADGRPFTSEVSRGLRGKDRISVNVLTRDADGNTMAVTHGLAHYVDAAKRQRSARKTTKRVLCSLLFTDIVDSTRHAERLGDQRWHELLEEQRKKVRAEIARCGGTEIDTAGDGFFVRFDSPADALDCVVAARNTVKPLGIEIRAGVHTGECEVTGRSYAGMAVHMGARIMAAAGAGEILVSSTVRDLVMGSGRNFADRGEHELKGLPGPWRLYALV